MSSIDFCNGYLSALQRLNSELSNAYADFEIEVLPQAADMAAALALRYEDYPRRIKLAREIPVGSWDIQTVPLDGVLDEPMRAILRKWFFHTRHMGETPSGRGGHHRENLVACFLGELESAVGPYKAFHVITSPPIWYAIDWDDIAIEAAGGRYLLHLSYSD